MTITLEVPTGKSFKSWLNFGNWQKVIGCEGCDSYFAKEDIDVYAPCKHCGGFLSGFKIHTAKWIDGRWAIRKQKDK